MDQVREEREMAVRGLVTEAHSAALPGSYLVWCDDPREALVPAAEAEGADLVVVGMDRSGSSRTGIGKVVEHLIRAAPCPVVVVRPTEASDRAVEILGQEAGRTATGRC